MLALAIGGRTIGELQQSMTHAEFRSWAAFYRQHPFDDLHRYHRPAALVAVSLGGGRIDDKLQFLAPDPVPQQYSSADMNTLKAFGIKPRASD